MFNQIRSHLEVAGYFRHRENAVDIMIEPSDTEKFLEEIDVDFVHFALEHESNRSLPPLCTERAAFVQEGRDTANEAQLRRESRPH
jgi:hypothetical protein